MNQNKNRRKEKADRDAQAVLGYISYKIKNMWNPSYREIYTFLKKWNITEDYFKQPEHNTKLKDKIKICVVGVLFNIPLSRDNIPGNSIMSWFNDLTEDDKKKVVSDEVFLLRREPHSK